MLVRKRGVGTQVVHPKVRRPVELTSLYDDLAKTARDPPTEIRPRATPPAPNPAADPPPKSGPWTPALPPTTPPTPWASRSARRSPGSSGSATPAASHSPS